MTQRLIPRSTGTGPRVTMFDQIANLTVSDNCIIPCGGDDAAALAAVDNTLLEVSVDIDPATLIRTAPNLRGPAFIMGPATAGVGNGVLYASDIPAPTGPAATNGIPTVNSTLGALPANPELGDQDLGIPPAQQGFPGMVGGGPTTRPYLPQTYGSGQYLYPSSIDPLVGGVPNLVIQGTRAPVMPSGGGNGLIELIPAPGAGKVIKVETITMSIPRKVQTGGQPGDNDVRNSYWPQVAPETTNFPRGQTGGDAVDTIPPGLVFQLNDRYPSRLGCAADILSNIDLTGILANNTDDVSTLLRSTDNTTPAPLQAITSVDTGSVPTMYSNMDSVQAYLTDPNAFGGLAQPINTNFAGLVALADLVDGSSEDETGDVLWSNQSAILRVSMAIGLLNDNYPNSLSPGLGAGSQNQALSRNVYNTVDLQYQFTNGIGGSINVLGGGAHLGDGGVSFSDVVGGAIDVYNSGPYPLNNYGITPAAYTNTVTGVPTTQLDAQAVTSIGFPEESSANKPLTLYVDRPLILDNSGQLRTSVGAGSEVLGKPFNIRIQYRIEDA